MSVAVLFRGVGSGPLAEGIECEGEATVCRELQFELAQGFYFGKPAPVTWFSSEPEPIQA